MVVECFIFDGDWTRIRFPAGPLKQRNNMKIKNHRIYSQDIDFLKRVAEDYDFLGRRYHLDIKNGVLTVFALPPRKRKKPKSDNGPRNKHAESAARRTER